MAKIITLRKTRIVYILSFICLAPSIIIYILEGIFQLVDPSSYHFIKYEPIDVVYTWVNGSDPIFLEDLKTLLKSRNISVDEKYLSQRFIDKNELLFSLRSLEKFAPWINHVYIVTNGQIPDWLNLESKEVTLVTHKEIFLDTYDLPTFSSPAIESHLHRIPGLSRKFLYFNDDVFLGQPIYMEDFFSPNDGYRLYFSYSLGMCAPQCFWAYVADDQCDSVCNNFYCQYDGGDCDNADAEKEDNFYPYNETKKRKIVSKFKLSREFNRTTNHSTVVDEYNNKMMENEKIKKKRYKRRQRKLREMKGIRKSSSNGSFLNRTTFAYGDSLQHSNRLFNLKYGFLPRFVPSHTPVFVEMDLIEKLQKKFFKEVLITSGNKFRNHDDLQFTFSYYYFIYHERNVFDAKETFKLFDTDKSGTWSDREIRTLLTRIYQLPLSYSIVEHFNSVLLNCSGKKVFEEVQTPKNERYLDSHLPIISKEMVLNCPELLKMLEASFGNKRKYKYKIVRNSEGQYVHFKQLNSNVTDVVGQLDEIRSEPRKFNCLNDNLDYTRGSENDFINSLLFDFYQSLFPFPSKYELPPGYRNKFLHVRELQEWKYRHVGIKFVVSSLAMFVLYLVGIDNLLKGMFYITSIFVKKYTVFLYNPLF